MGATCIITAHLRAFTLVGLISSQLTTIKRFKTWRAAELWMRRSVGKEVRDVVSRNGQVRLWRWEKGGIAILSRVNNIRPHKSMAGRHEQRYRVGLVIWQLGWVDLDLECSTILLGQ